MIVNLRRGWRATGSDMLHTPAESEMNVRAATNWEFKVNPNTILHLVTIGSVLVGLGMIWQENKAGVQANARAIEQHQQLITQLANSMSTYSNLPYRVQAMEVRLGSAETAQRDTDRTLNQLASDIRLMREILERLDPQSPRRR